MQGGTGVERGMSEAESEADGQTEAGGVELGALGGQVGYQLRRAQLAVFADFHRGLGELEIRPAQYAVLLILRQTPGLQQSLVADALGIKRANFVTLFDGLQARGLVRRQPSATDRRAVRLYLTEAGAQAMERIEELVAAHEARVSAALGEQGRAHLLALLARLHAL
jgi:DNA-binding MarR family transcriptional regulator